MRRNAKLNLLYVTMGAATSASYYTILFSHSRVKILCETFTDRCIQIHNKSIQEVSQWRDNDAFMFGITVIPNINSPLIPDFRRHIYVRRQKHRITCSCFLYDYMPQHKQLHTQTYTHTQTN